MIRYECDRCGERLGANDPKRFIVKLEVYAAAGHLEFTESDLDATSKLNEVIEELAVADPDELEDQTYRHFRFDVCDACRKIILSNPLGIKSPQ